mgnify:CR=1 FL=1
MPDLRLKGQENANPLFAKDDVIIQIANRWKVHQQRAVLPDAVVFLETRPIALVHVDVVNAVTRLEAKIFVPCVVGSGPQRSPKA